MTNDESELEGFVLDGSGQTLRVLAGDHLFEIEVEDVLERLPLAVPNGMVFEGGVAMRVRLAAGARLRHVLIATPNQHLSVRGRLPFALAARDTDAPVQTAPGYSARERAFLRENDLV